HLQAVALISRSTAGGHQRPVHERAHQVRVTLEPSAGQYHRTGVQLAVRLNADNCVTVKTELPGARIYLDGHTECSSTSEQRGKETSATCQNTLSSATG